MCQAYLADEVFPNVPLRQWVTNITDGTNKILHRTMVQRMLKGDPDL